MVGGRAGFLLLCGNKELTQELSPGAMWLLMPTLPASSAAPSGQVGRPVCLEELEWARKIRRNCVMKDLEPLTAEGGEVSMALLGALALPPPGRVIGGTALKLPDPGSSTRKNNNDRDHG